MDATVEKMLGQTQEQTKQEFKEFTLTKLKKKFIYPLLKGGLSPEKIKQVVVEVQEHGYNGVLALPSYLSAISAMPQEIKVGVVIGYPFGESLLAEILASIKRWKSSLVDEICVVLPLSDLKFNKGKFCEKIIKNLNSLSKKKQVSVMFDSAKLNDSELTKVVKLVFDSKLTTVYTSSGIYGEKVEERIFNAISELKKKSALVGVTSVVEEIDQVKEILSKCDLVICDKATETVERIKQQIEI